MQLPMGYDVKLTDKEYNLFVNYIYQHSGISLGANKRELLKARLMKRLRFHQLKSYEQYFEFLQKDPRGEDELVELLNAISTNVTSFFRESQHFDFMAKRVLPELVQIKEKERSKEVRIWCAAAATGEEVYTLLMVLLDFFGENSPYNIKLLGTDISTKALKAAIEGEYTAEKVSGIPKAMLNKYFDKFERDGRKMYRAGAALKSRATLRRFNLMSGAFPFKHKFDIVFCRNVMIYFDKPTQLTLVRKIHQHLHEHGYLFIGHSESLLGAETGFVNVCPAGFAKMGYKH